MTKFVPNPRLEGELARSTQVKETLEDLARRGAELYAASVPIDTGDLQASIFGDVALTEDGFVGRIGAKDPMAGLVEFGTIENAPDASLRSSIEALGLTLEPSDRKA